MATTTNYGWTTPDDTSLVKDGAAAIRTLGSSVDTTTKALNPSTTLGDIEYRSATANTNTRLGIGTTGQILTVNGGVPAWATPSSGSMTQLATGTLSGSSTVISGLSGSYRDLRVTITGYRAAASGSNLQLRINNDSTANRHHASAFTYFGAGLTYNATFMNGLTDGCPATATNTLVKIEIPEYANTTTLKMVQWYSIANNDSTTVGKLTGANGVYNQIGAVTGLTFLCDGSTFAGGTYTVYGVN
ncbi:hypothetical protein UFOVP443_9 [uncultured Caudovirales phage]|uniref:Bacteriophage lambda, Stf, side tail fibre-repeat-2 n=1 Tax=uncultured Caudovirales phage TaxID=2100421 RepID=A0A6J5M573_9CAUD|nr:hypothetical protein UFOVP443_9 [uncultured Caudovirales phage]